MADAVAVFSEGTFEEQIQELVNYLARGLADEARAAYIRPFQEALQTPEGKKPLAEDADRRKKIIGMVREKVVGLGEGTDREIEGFFNLLISHLVTLFTSTPDLEPHVSALVGTITAAPETQTGIVYRVLSNLFNGLPRKSSLRRDVYLALLKLASDQGDLDVLQIERADVKRWLSEWEISEEEGATFLETVAEAFRKAGDAKRLTAISSFTCSTSARSLLRRLLRVDTLEAVQDHPLYSLLKIFSSGDLAQYHSWESEHASILAEFGMDKEILLRKIRLLTLASIASAKIGRDVPYAEIASALRVQENEVESWAIDAIRHKLIGGKLSQATSSIHITRSSTRAFGTSQWQDLEAQLVQWKTNLTEVSKVIAQARKIAAGSSSTAGTARTAVAEVGA
ncbi:UDP-glucose:glycoprotein glucosyltransferase A [Ceratobasidium sp. AG-Ba]|nr:UDP-glucose:glycoprotein glucosyltransferase A [Ceratobasidium sp. AG-Ba]